MDEASRQEIQECIELREEIERFMANTTIQGMDQSQLLEKWKHSVMLIGKYIRLFFDEELDIKYWEEDWPPPATMDDQLETLGRIRHFERYLRYAAHGRELFPLAGREHDGPRIHMESIHMDSLISYAVLARILFLTRRGRQGRGTFPTDGSLRYDNPDFEVEPEDVNGLLPQQYQFLRYVNRRKPLSLEWEAVVGLVGSITLEEYQLVETIYLQCEAEGILSPYTAKPVETFTTPGTSEALASDCGDCPACTKGFGDTGADDVEPAVKTRCGHFMGKACLQTWVDVWEDEEKTGVPTCPHCRAPLDDLITVLPPNVQPVVREWMAYARSDSELDGEVDAFPLAAREQEAEQCFDVSLGVMLEKLETRRNRFLAYNDAVQEGIMQCLRIG